MNWYKIKIAKSGELKFISHLDWQNLIIKTFKRMGLKLALSQGFSPTPKVSFSPALPLFIESECEIVYFETTSPLSGSENPVFKPEGGEPEGCEKSDGGGQPRALFDTGLVEPLNEVNFAENFAKNISENAKLKEFSKFEGDKKPQSLETHIQWAKYEAHIAATDAPIPVFDASAAVKNFPLPKFEDVVYNMKKCLLSDNLFIKKINKKGFEKNIDYKSSVKNIEFDEKNEKIVFILKAGQDSDVPALRADDFLAAVFGKDVLFEIKRTRFFDTDLREI